MAKQESLSGRRDDPATTSGQAFRRRQRIARAKANEQAAMRNNAERKRLETQLDERVKPAQLQAMIGTALIGHAELPAMLQACVQTLVETFGAALARVWTLNEPEQMLELQASAGLYTHLDAFHRRVPVGKFKIGHIAQERKPYFTNQFFNDVQCADQEWAQREQISAFAGYPLLVQGRMVGVIAIFARQPLYEGDLPAIATVADIVVDIVADAAFDYILPP